MHPEAPNVTADSRYAQAALDNELDVVRTAPVGQRNDALNVAAFKVSRFFLTKELHAGAVAEVLVSAAVASGLPEVEARRTIASAFESRMRHA